MKIEQGTEEWLNLRKGKITASKIAIIIGWSPYQTPLQLWEEELGFRPPQETKQHMLDGLAAETEMADFFYEQTGIEVVPEVVFHKDYPKFMASLDGINLLRTIITEFKNNNKSYHEMARAGSVVGFHQAQMQWQMFCEGEHIREVRYVSRNSGEKIIVIVPRDDEFIEKLKAAAFEFLRMLDDLEEPPLTDADYEDVSRNYELQQVVNEYREAQSLSKYYNDLAESHKKCIIQSTNDRNVRGMDWKMTKSSRKGNVDYDKLCQELNISESQKDGYRKPSTTSYRITLQ